MPPLPPFLEGKVKPQAYTRWLRRKALAHCKRDCKRGNPTATARKYRKAIHRAVLRSSGLCYYTGEPLKWKLISTFNNEKAKEGGRRYLLHFAELPTVDHVGDGRGAPRFVTCGFALNAAKSYLSYKELLALCESVLKYRAARARSPHMA